MKRIVVIFFLFGFLISDLKAQTSIKLDKYMDSIFKPFNNKNSPGCAATILITGLTVWSSRVMHHRFNKVKQ